MTAYLKQLTLMFAATHQENADSCEPKFKRINQNYRRQIRQGILNAEFRVIREEMMQKEHLELVKNLLERVKESFTEGNLLSTIEMLQMNEDDSVLNHSYQREKVEVKLTWLLKRKGNDMTLQERLSLVRTLTYLSYFGQESSHKIIDDMEFIDWVRKEVKDLSMGQSQDVAYLMQAARLMVNLSSQRKEDFNLYLAESDVMRMFADKLGIASTLLSNSSLEFKEEVNYALKIMLRVVKNVVSSQRHHSYHVEQLLITVLSDREYFISQPLLCFELLDLTAQKEELWWKLAENPRFRSILVQASAAIDQIQERCFTRQFLDNRDNCMSSAQMEGFYSILCFLNSLYRAEYSSHCSSFGTNDWEEIIVNCFNGYMLAVYLEARIIAKDSFGVAEAIRMYCNLSEFSQITADQLVVVRPCDDPISLIRLFTSEALMGNSRFGHYTMAILSNLLAKDSSYLEQLMEMRVVDGLVAAMDMYKPAHLLCSALSLLRQLIFCNEAQKTRMYKTLESQGVLKAADELSRHDCREVYDRYDMLNSYLEEVRRGLEEQ